MDGLPAYTAQPLEAGEGYGLQEYQCEIAGILTAVRPERRRESAEVEG